MKHKRERMYCSPEFKKMLQIRSIEYGEKDLIKFTRKAARNPHIILNEEKIDKKKPFRSLF